MPALRISTVGGTFPIFLSEPHPHNHFDAGRLERFYGLTPTEAKITILLVQGLRVVDVAKELDVSLNTARSHVRQIFAKTGANRQAEVVRMILSGVMGLNGGRLDASQSTHNPGDGIIRDRVDPTELGR